MIAVVNKTTRLVVRLMPDDADVNFDKQILVVDGARILDVTKAEYLIIRGVPDYPGFIPNLLVYRGSWVLDYAKKQHGNALRAERDSRIHAPINNVSVGTERDQLEIKSTIANFAVRVAALKSQRPNFSAAVSALPDSNVIPYLGVDGTPLFLTKENLESINEEFESRYTRTWFDFGLLINQVAQAATLAEVHQIWFDN